MALTGINGIRAYPSSDLSADLGFLARATLIYKTGIPNLSMNMFIEHAEGKPRKSLDNHVYLHGYGIGLGYSKPDDYFAKLDYARRIGFDEALSERAKARGRFWFIAGKIFWKGITAAFRKEIAGNTLLTKPLQRVKIAEDFFLVWLFINTKCRNLIFGGEISGKNHSEL